MPRVYSRLALEAFVNYAQHVWESQPWDLPADIRRGINLTAPSEADDLDAVLTTALLSATALDAPTQYAGAVPLFNGAATQPKLAVATYLAGIHHRQGLDDPSFWSLPAMNDESALPDTPTDAAPNSSAPSSETETEPANTNWKLLAFVPRSLRKLIDRWFSERDTDLCAKAPSPALHEPVLLLEGAQSLLLDQGGGSTPAPDDWNEARIWLRIIGFATVIAFMASGQQVVRTLIYVLSTDYTQTTEQRWLVPDWLFSYVTGILGWVTVWVVAGAIRGRILILVEKQRGIANFLVSSLSYAGLAALCLATLHMYSLPQLCTLENSWGKTPYLLPGLAPLARYLIGATSFAVMVSSSYLRASSPVRYVLRLLSHKPQPTETDTFATLARVEQLIFVAYYAGESPLRCVLLKAQMLRLRELAVNSLGTPSPQPRLHADLFGIKA
jgi:hypothetical protein